jgi:hypothetical protein
MAWANRSAIEMGEGNTDVGIYTKQYRVQIGLHFENRYKNASKNVFPSDLFRVSRLKRQPNVFEGVCFDCVAFGNSQLSMTSTDKSISLLASQDKPS